MRKRTLFVFCAAVALAGCLDEGAPGEGGGTGVGAGSGGVVMEGFFLGPGFAVFFSPEGDAKFTTSWPSLVDEFDIAAASAKDPKNAGRWRTTAETLTIVFGGGNTWVCRIVSPDQFQIESGRKGDIGTYVTRPPMVSSSARGAFKQSNFTVLGTNRDRTGNNTVSGDHWVTFKGEGAIEFYDELFAYVNGQAISSQTTVTGDYSIDGYTITITDEKGNVSRKDLWVRSGTSEAPTLITLGSKVYERP
jgi:hypothetical protein